MCESYDQEFSERIVKFYVTVSFNTKWKWALVHSIAKIIQLNATVFGHCIIVLINFAAKSIPWKDSDHFSETQWFTVLQPFYLVW